MNSGLSFAVVFIAIVSLTSGSIVLLSYFVLGQQKIGVEVGDWAKYQVVHEKLQNQTLEWLRVEILSIEGKNMTLLVTSHLFNGTEVNQTTTYDLATGGCSQALDIPERHEVYHYYWYWSKFLSNLFISSSEARTHPVTGECVGNFSGVTRTVVYWDSGVWPVMVLSPGGHYTDLYSYCICWDKLTGILSAMIQDGDWPPETLIADESFHGMRLIETNIWH